MKLTKIIRGAFVVLVVGAIVMSGIAFAQADDTPSYRHRADPHAELVEDGVIPRSRALGAGGRGPGEGQAAAAEVLGLSVEELRDRLLEGATLAEIAGDRAEDVVDALMADRVERIEAAVADGRITQEEADERLDGLQGHVEDFVNGRFEPEAFRHGRRGGPGGAGPGPGDCEPNLYGAASA
ncbi:MAG TPA: hypothetical protein VLD62_09450 [Acidimicrobiia bacterium]|nr:hypothetical protein [Acidimicrobiia bacterium]